MLMKLIVNEFFYINWKTFEKLPKPNGSLGLLLVIWCGVPLFLNLELDKIVYVAPLSETQNEVLMMISSSNIVPAQQLTPFLRILTMYRALESCTGKPPLRVRSITRFLRMCKLDDTSAKRLKLIYYFHLFFSL